MGKGMEKPQRTNDGIQTNTFFGKSMKQPWENHGKNTERNGAL
jgi:hypothetical protein